ncbi:MAG: galactokinase [Candidatus Marinimicrobia bacterium]|nr:galactokinase [Candidatus Neomarinimicrobiota bacterium]
MAEYDTLVLETQTEHRTIFDSAPEVITIAPGRINIIGEHTDYNGGLALPAAINRWICVAVSRRNDTMIEAVSLDFEEEYTLGPNDPLDRAPGWMRYVGGAVKVFTERSGNDSGWNIVIHGNLPIGAGLSSSAALEMAILNALREATRSSIDDLELIKLGRQVEHQYLGLSSGLLDQYAIQFSRSDRLLLIDFYDLTHSYTPVGMKNFCWAIVDSGVRRELTDSRYEQRVQECRVGLTVLQSVGAPVETIRDITAEQLEKYKSASTRLQMNRLWHVVSENNRVVEAVRALKICDFNYLGALLKASHTSLRDDYEVSCPVLDILVEAAAGPGCPGARMMGGGFGGCIIALVAEKNWDIFKRRVEVTYRNEFLRKPKIYKFDLVDGASIIDLQK